VIMRTNAVKAAPAAPVSLARLTPQTTIEAIMYCVRERGLGALKEPINQERLSRCDATARQQINERVDRLKKAGVVL